MAYLIWAYVSDQYAEIRPGVAFNIHFDTGDEVAVQSDVHQVTATLKGSRGSVMSVVSSQPTINYKMKVTVDDMKKGATREIKLTRDVFNLPPDVYISNISPKEFTVSFGTEADRYIPVEAHIINRSKAQYPFEVKVYPSEARVYGPASSLYLIPLIHTEAIDVAGRGTDFSRHVKIFETQESSSLRSSEVIRVDVHFLKTTKTSTFSDLPLEVIRHGSLLSAQTLRRVEETKVTVVVEHSEVLSTQHGLQAVVSVRDIKPGQKVVRKIQIINPKELHIVSVNPPSITIDEAASLKTPQKQE